MSPPTTDPVKLEVTLKYATTSEFDARFASNVAADTVFLKTPKPKPVGTVVSLELRLAGGEVALAGHGPVVCAFEGASIPEGRQPGMIIALTPVDDASAKRIRSIVVKYGQGRNAVLPPGVAKPAVAAPVAVAASAAQRAPERPPAQDLGELMPDLDAAIDGLGAGDSFQALAPPIAGPPPVIVSSTAQDLMDPGPGLVMVQPSSPPASAARPAVPSPSAPPSPVAAGAELSASSWTSELDAALGTAFDVDKSLPTPPAPKPRTPPQRSLEGMFGPPEMVSTEPEGASKLRAERAFSMPPPAPAPTPMAGILRAEQEAPAAPPVDDMLAPAPKEGFWLGAEPEAAPPASQEPEPAPAAIATPMLDVSNPPEGQDEMLAPETSGTFTDAPPPESMFGQRSAPGGTPEVIETQVDFVPPELRPAVSMDDAAMQAIVAGTAPAEFKPAFKPEEPLPAPIVVSAPRRHAAEEAELRADSLPREEPGSAPALVGAIVEDTQPPPGVEGDAAAQEPAAAPSALQGAPDVTAPLPHAQPSEPEWTAPVRARPPRTALSRRTLGIAAGVGGLVGLLLFVLLRLILAEPEHVVRFRQANELVRAGKSSEAIPVYQSILASNPDFTLAKRHLAVALALTGQREQAESLLRSYVGTSDDLADVETVKKYLGEAEPNLVE